MNTSLRSTITLFISCALLLVFAGLVSTVHASHAWGNYHWARTSNPFSIRVIDSMTSDWDDNLDVAISDWSISSVMNVVEQTGDSSIKTRKRCPAVSGKVRSCNASYGNNGWLGLAQIWASGSHITQGTAKMNDTYFLSPRYSETARQHVICQEIGHAWGLDHQDESGADLNTCMDYSNTLDNAHPNQHDYAMLETIYAHLDSVATSSGWSAGGGNGKPTNVGQDIDLDNPSAWGQSVREDEKGNTSFFVRDLGHGEKVFTFVIWAE